MTAGERQHCNCERLFDASISEKIPASAGRNDHTAAMDANICAECGATLKPSATDAAALIAEAREIYQALFARVPDGGPAIASSADTWPPNAYLWHVVDVLRFGAERLWMLSLDPTAAVIVWDADEIAAARGYAGLSVAVGLHALDHATTTWLDAFASTPTDAVAYHPEIGAMTALVMAQRNAHEVTHHTYDIARGLGLR